MKKEKDRRKDRTEKKKIPISDIVVIAIILSGVIGWFIWTSEEVSLEKAMENSNLREKYIEKVVAEIGKPENVVSIDYLTFQEVKELAYKGKLNPNDLAATVNTREVTPEELGKIPIPVKIFITPRAFETATVASGEDFKALLEQEFHHAKVFGTEETPGADFEKFRTIDGEFNLALFINMMELSGCRAILHSSRDISSAFRENLIMQYLVYYTNIWYLEKRLEERMDPEFIKSLKVEFFEDWIVERLDLIQEDSQWYFRDPVTKEKCYLPEEIINMAMAKLFWPEREIPRGHFLLKKREF